jgi:hypothetical protein
MSAIERHDRQTGQRRNAAPSTAHSNHPKRVELLERLVGPEGTLPDYGHELTNITHKADALRLKQHALLKRVQELQARRARRQQAERAEPAPQAPPAGKRAT